jgi:glutamyl-tRNA reductase
MHEQNIIPEIALVGMSHKTAPVELRECFSLYGEEGREVLARLGKSGIREAVYVATCNRVEVYFAATDVIRGTQSVMSVLEELSPGQSDRFDGALYRKYGRDAVRHLLYVSASLDSMVIGENEILGQLKKSYSMAVQAGMTGVVMNRLFHCAFRAAKKVRTETDIAKNPLSIAYIATELARRIFEHLGERRALLVGAGEMGELILKYLTKNGIGEITIANRSLHNAERIAAEINRATKIIGLDDIPGVLAGVDIVISSVTSKRCVINADMMRDAVRRREGQPVFMIDIAVPRNIEPAVHDIHAVFLYNIDDLRGIADENLKNRLSEVEIARGLVENDADDFYRWYEGLVVVPAIARLKKKFDEIRKKETARYRSRKLKHLAEEDFRLIEDLTVQIMTKTLHNPIMHLRQYQDELSGGHCGRDTVKEKTRLIMDLFEKEK